MILSSGKTCTEYVCFQKLQNEGEKYLAPRGFSPHSLRTHACPTVCAENKFNS
jgi:hypothetical protein